LALALALAPGSPVAAQREDSRPPRTPLELEPLRGRGPGGLAGAEIVPVLARDQVLVSTTLRLFALDACSGEILWSAGPPRGWEELEPEAYARAFVGLDHEQLLVAPAAGERIAVAALQVPWTRRDYEEWQGLAIAIPLPERRLFAFELASGAPRWDHAPPPGGDGAGGAFSERMSLVASPLVVGARVLVPCTSDESSIDYHVACYRLETGALLWTTFVTRGQVERNLFGRQSLEFATAPLVAAPDGRTLLAQTDLGLVAALDLATGEVLWRTEYAPLPLPQAKGYAAQKRKEVWRVAPPLVVGEVVLATPRDGAELLALELSSGRRLWAEPMESLRALDGDDQRGLDHLIGADADALYLGGEKVCALAKGGGLASDGGWQVRFTLPLAGSAAARARLAGDALFVPTRTEVLERFIRYPWRRRAFAAQAARGILAIEGALFVLGEGGMRRLER
jgi:outer membrane protein assembly factor BamB